MDAVLDENQQLDFYHGGGLDMACLGLAECDAAGNVNVSRFGGRLNGAGGFVNISQNARPVVFVGSFNGAGLKVSAVNGELRILQEVTEKKFLKQITFNGQYRVRRGLALIEVAPGTGAARDILAHMDFELIIRLDEAFAQRNIAPHVFERKEEAQAFLAAVGVGTGNDV